MITLRFKCLLFAVILISETSKPFLTGSAGIPRCFYQGGIGTPRRITCLDLLYTC